MTRPLPPSAPLPPLRRITGHGVDLACLDVGEGPPVLLIHGFPDDHTVWEHQIGPLVAAGFRVIAPDTRGCGESAMPGDEGAYGIEALVADQIALLDALGIERLPVVGHDWGAVEAWHLAIAHPERVTRLAALSVGHPAAYATDGWRQKLRGWYVLVFQWRGVAEWLIRLGNWRGMRKLIPDQAEAAKIVARLSRPGRLTAGINYYRANFSAFLRQPTQGRLAMPVLGLFSTGDRYLTTSQMQRSGAWCDAGFDCQVIEGVAHWLQREAPEWVNERLIGFLRG